MSKVTEQLDGDISLYADILDDGLVYHDRPLQGFLRRRSDGRLFAFECDSLEGEHIVRWTLVLADNVSEDAEAVLASGHRSVAETIIEKWSGPTCLLRITRYLPGEQSSS